MNLAFVIVTTVLIVTLVHTVPDEEKNRRSLMQLHNMVTLLTNRSAFEFIEYGNYCGPGGKGDITDTIDQCCYDHDKCYTNTTANKCKHQKEGIAYRIEYDLEIKDNELDIACKEDKSTENDCKLAVCTCDLIAAKCFATAPYDPSNKKSLLNIVSKLIRNPSLGEYITTYIFNMFAQTQTVKETQTDTETQTETKTETETETKIVIEKQTVTGTQT